MEKKYSGFLCYDKLYKDAIKALHSLQSNAAYLKSVAKQNPSIDPHKLKDTEKYLLRSGITLEKLDTLSVIHVAGTKGKGSACAFTEAILRKHGFTTGFFSSPHLVTVRERIRINGQPISQSQFAHYFWKVYNKLENAKEHESDMPTYFKFLTILMFNIFLDINIDVAIIEVGIGGLSDCTNIVRNPVCVGITSLGLDHTSLLGSTLQDIAYQKSGIFKSKTVAFTVPQTIQAMQVLQKRAIEKDCTLHIVPSFEEHTWKLLSPLQKVMSNAQQQNASLAIQMASEWMNSKKDKQYRLERRSERIINQFSAKYHESTETNASTRYIEASDIVSIDKIAAGLSSCRWPGRTQILKSSIGHFYLDGAHTIESMDCCISWFKSVASISRGRRYLIFNTSGDRDPLRLLMPLKSLGFQKAYFVPNYAGIKSVDDDTNCFCMDEQRLKCEKNCETWGAGGTIASSVLEVLQIIQENSVHSSNYSNNEKPQILVTGSLHLIGAVLTILDPNLTMSTKF